MTTTCEPNTAAAVPLRSVGSRAKPAVHVPEVRNPDAKPSVILGAVAPIPYRSEAAEAAINQQLSREVAEAAGQAATQGARPLSKNAYKVPLVKTAVKRALLRAAGDEYWTNQEA